MNNTILIVDDMKVNIDVLTTILCRNYQIMAAISGENAIKLLSRKVPDLVLLDVFMPGIDGFGVLKYMKEHRELSNIPVIFVTGEHDIGLEEKGLELGAVDYIKKPFNAAIIASKVKNHLELKAYRDGLEQLVIERTKQLAASREAIIMGMSLMSETHDKVTGDHIERIKLFTRILAEKMVDLYPDVVTPELVEQIIIYSPLHDVGKVGISDRILKKTGVLTHEEFNIMKTHTVEGASLLRKTEYFLIDNKSENNLDVAIEIAEYHHEKYDGTGYPHGLKGDQIPISARIVTIADIYDALRSARPYKRSFTHEESVSIILQGDRVTCVSHFDPRVIEAFKEVHEEFDGVYEGE